MAEGGHGHHYKLILALALIVGILALLAYANTGEKLFNDLRIGRFADVEPPVQSKPFEIVMTTGTTTLHGKTFALSNAVVYVNGICNILKVGGLTIEKDSARCVIETSDFAGSFDYNKFGSVMLAGRSSSVTVDSVKYSDVSVAWEAEVIPIDFSVSGISEDKLSLIVPSGKIEKFSNGELRVVSYLSGSSVDISNFLGSFSLSEGELRIGGSATAVKNEDFSW